MSRSLRTGGRDAASAAALGGAAERSSTGSSSARASRRRKAATTSGSNWRPAWSRISCDRLLERPRLLVRARVGEDVEDVGDGGDAARRAGCASPVEAARVAGAVPALVVRAGDLLGEAEDRRAAAGEDAAADLGVLLEHLALVVGQRARLEPDGVRDADLADVVQRRGVAQVLDRVGGEAELAGRAARRCGRRAWCAAAVSSSRYSAASARRSSVSLRASSRSAVRARTQRWRSWLRSSSARWRRRVWRRLPTRRRTRRGRAAW